MHISRRAAECRRLPPLPRRLERSCTLRESSRISSLSSSLAASTFPPILSPTSSTCDIMVGVLGSPKGMQHSLPAETPGNGHNAEIGGRPIFRSAGAAVLSYDNQHIAARLVHTLFPLPRGAKERKRKWEQTYPFQRRSRQSSCTTASCTNFSYPYFRHIEARVKCRRARTAQAASSTARKTTRTVSLRTSQQRRKRSLAALSTLRPTR